jgi:uncharacterized coiled-coil protein SlyX
MKTKIQLKITILPLVVAFGLASLALLPRAQAVFPAPDGGYPGDNTAEGTNALFSLFGGVQNTALGFSALLNLTTGNANTAVGLCSLVHNNGSWNVATGAFPLFNNTSGAGNVATGYGALYFNTTASRNTGVGYQSLHSDVAGSDNTAIGSRAGYNIKGSGNVCIGSGVLGLVGENNTTRIRNVYGSLASARVVYVNSDNKIGTLFSTRRVKDEIKPMDKASEAILALKPVTFRYKKEVDPARALSFGLIAEEVAKISSDLITRDEDGEPQTVRYEAVNAMLLNEFLKEHRKVQEQENTITELKSVVAQQQKEMKALASGLKKVSAQVEISRSMPQVVLNSR